MQGRQYRSPSKKYLGQTPVFVSNLGHKLKKISARQAAIPLPKPKGKAADIMAAYRKMMEEEKRREMAQNGVHDGPSYDNCGGVGNGDEADIDDGYSGDHELLDNEEDDNEEEEEDSFENMQPDGIEERVKAALGRQVFNQGYFKNRRSYAYNAKRYKANWRNFIECVTGELAWLSLSNPTSICGCKASVTLPAVSLTGTALLLAMDKLMYLRMLHDAL